MIKQKKISISSAILLSIFSSFIFAFIVMSVVIKNRTAELDGIVSKEADLLMEKMVERVTLYQYGLRGARAFVLSQETNGGLTRVGFQHYAVTRDNAREFPGARGFGFIRRVASSQVEEFIGRAQADDFPEFSIRQLQPNNAEHYVIQYIEPVDNNRAAVGLDIASEKHRRAAAQRAIETGEAQLTGPITLVQATGSPQQSFLFLMPVYRTWVTPSEPAQRWKEAIGWSYAPLLMKEILDSVKVDADLFRLRLSDTTDASNIETFYSLNESNVLGKMQYRQEVVFGRTWSLELSGTQLLSNKLHPFSPAIVFAISLIIGAVLCTLVIAMFSYWQTRAKLFRQASRLASFVEGSSDAIIGIDQTGCIRSWNRGAIEIFGFSADEVLGKQLVDLPVPAGLETESLRLIRQMREGMRETNLITHRKQKDGTEFDAMISAEPIFNDKQQVVGGSLTIRDISPIKRAEQELALLNAKLEEQVESRTQELSRTLKQNQTLLELKNSILTSSPLAVIATDTKGLITLFNPAAEKLLGYQADEMIGIQTPAIFHDADEVANRAKEFSQELGEPIAPGFDVLVVKSRHKLHNEYEWTYIHKYQTRIPVLLSVSALRNLQGEITGYLGMASDITQQKLIQHQLTSIKDQLAKAVEIAHLGIWTWSIEDNSLDWNEKMFEIYDQPISLKDNGLNYDHWRSRLHKDDVVAAENNLRDAVEGRSVYDIIFRVSDSLGNIKFVQAGGHVERDAKGIARRVIGINIDITAQRNAEEKLRLAKEEADAANNAKSQFLANMSHEIRTPMNGVLGMLDLLKRTPLGQQQQDYLNKANSAARSLLGILNDILDFSKISAKKMTLDPTEFDWEDLLAELGVILAGNLKGKPVEVVFDRDWRLPDLMIGDRLRILQVLINLAGNALKFTEVGQVIIRLSLLEEKPDSTVVMRIQVEDSGIGMSEEQQAHLFQSFSQAETSTTRRYGGTGLGLVISKRLLELMGSDLHLESQLNKGSCFWFDLSLPFITRQLPNANQPHQLIVEHKVLVVDDSPLLVDLLAEGLTHKGWRVVKAQSGAAALKAIEDSDKSNDPFDVVLMDWNMLSMSGFEACQKIRSRKSHNVLPQIIMITAYERELINEMQDAGQKPFDQLIVKPVTIEKVHQLLLASVTAEQPTSLADAGDSSTPATLAGIKILLVEDNELNQQVASELLTLAGAIVSVASCGLEGVEKVLRQTESFDLVLMDIQMPDIDGLEATRRIRAQGSFSTLPIIAMTANASESDRLACLAAGMNDHIGKPFDMHKLVPLIRRYIGAGVGHEAACPSAEEQKAKEEQNAKEERVSSAQLIEPVATILGRFSKNRELAARMRDRFGKEMEGLMKKMEAAIQAKSQNQLTSVFHSIKGVAATLGAVQLADVAAGLEAQSREGVWAAEESISSLKNLVDDSVLALARLNFDAENISAPIQLSRETLRSLLDEVDVFLAEDNMGAMAIAEKLAAAFKANADVNVFYEQVESLDFSAAQKTLQTVKEVLLSGSGDDNR